MARLAHAGDTRRDGERTMKAARVADRNGEPNYGLHASVRYRNRR
jgi:hypothetical protein